MTTRRVPTPHLTAAKLCGPGVKHDDGSPAEFHDRQTWAHCGPQHAAARWGCVSLPGQVGDRGNCEFWPSRVPTYPHSQLVARSVAIPTYPPSGAEFRERPPSRRAQWYLPALARCLPAPRPYLPTLAQVFPIAAVTYLPGQRDATQGTQASRRRHKRP